MKETYCCTLAKGETRTTAYFIRYFRTCPKKYLHWTLPCWIPLLGIAVLFTVVAYVVGNIYFTPISVLRGFALALVYCLIWGILVAFLVKYAWRFNLYRANIKTDRELLVWISEDRLTIIADADSKWYIFFIFYPEFKKRNEVIQKNKRIGGFITDVYECEAGLYFWLFLTPYPAAFLAKSKFNEEEYASLREMLKNIFKGRYHDVSK